LPFPARLTDFGTGTHQLDCSLLYLTVIRLKGWNMENAIPDRLAILTVSGTQEDILFTHFARVKCNFPVINSSGEVF
jgi:hypothetical protein